jgi:hypothetical protein
MGAPGMSTPCAICSSKKIGTRQGGILTVSQSPESGSYFAASGESNFQVDNLAGLETDIRATNIRYFEASDCLFEKYSRGEGIIGCRCLIHARIKRCR